MNFNDVVSGRVDIDAEIERLQKMKLEAQRKRIEEQKRKLEEQKKELERKELEKKQPKKEEPKKSVKLSVDLANMKASIEYKKNDYKGKPIVICKNRGLKFDETITLNTLYSVLPFDYKCHGKKSISKLVFECLVVDVSKKECFMWVKKQKAHLCGDDYHFVFLSLSNKSLKKEEIDKLKKDHGYDTVIKYIPMADNVEDFEDNLYDHERRPQNTLLDGCLRLFSGEDKKKG
jgi:hypothetical protein